jgi:hypothetical protein
MAGGGILDFLGRLVGKSLVVVDAPEDGETRYRLLETIRQYALEKLLAAGEVAETRQRHVDFYLQLAEKLELKIYGLDSGASFRRLYRELDNLRSAIDWGTTSGKAELAQRMLGAIVYFWMAHGLPSSEWNDRVHEALNRPEGRQRTLARAKALNGTGFMYWVDAYPIEEGAELEEALAIGTELGDATTQATALGHLGQLETVHGHYDRARQFFQKSLAIWRSLEPEGRIGMGRTLANFGDVGVLEGNAVEARSILQDAVRALEATGDPNFRAYAVRRLAQLAWRAGQVQAAYALCRQSLELNLEVADPRGTCACLAGFVAIAAVSGELEKAVVLSAAVEHQLAALGIALLYPDRLEFEGNLKRLPELLKGRQLAKLRAKGATMSMEQAIEFALQMAA